MARELGIPFVVANVLATRGLTDADAAAAFLAPPNKVPSPFLFSDMAQAVEMVAEAVDNRRRIVVHGDYDADGITATATMVLGLRELGVEAQPFLPNRFTQGFGLSRSAVEDLAADGGGLLITVDCGVNYPDEVARARELGFDVIVIDHHEPGPVMPDCLVIHSAVGTYPGHHLCGVGLAFKVLHGLGCELFGESAEEVSARLHRYLDLVAIGTIADLAPLVAENRYYAKEGLKLLSIGSRVGTKALASVAACAGAVDSSAVAFRLAPRLNAAGRIAAADLPLQLLLTDDEAIAQRVSQQLHDLNLERQGIERGILDEAVAQVEELAELPPVLVLTGAGWHEGVVGIVASHIVEKFHRPAVMLSVKDGVAKGSGRSIAGYDLVSALTDCDEWLTVYGGHAMAAGLTMEEEDVGAFREALQAHAAARLSAADFVPSNKVDAILRPEEISADTATALAALGPFGSGNPRPRLAVVGATLTQPQATRTGDHLRCSIEVDQVRARAIGFGFGEFVGELQQRPTRSIVGVQLKLNEWQGNMRPEFVIDGIGEPVASASGPFVKCASGCLMRAEPSRAKPGSTRSGNSMRGADCLETGASAPPESLNPPKLRTCDQHAETSHLSVVAGVLATGEPTLLLTCSVRQAIDETLNRLPLAELTGGDLACVGQGCISADSARLDGHRVVLAEWDAAESVRETVLNRVHVVTLDPPYRREHTQLLADLQHRGAEIHSCYGNAARGRTSRFLKYLVHPRFAMVCVYRALAGGAQDQELKDAAAQLAWDEGGVVLTDEALDRAYGILTQLGLEQLEQGQSRMEARSVPVYVNAEAEYEECKRLCQTL